MKYWIAMVISFLLMIAVNVLGGTGNINGQSQSDISNKLDVLFTPAGYVFSIWSLIYVAVAIWLVLQFLHVKKHNTFNKHVYLLFIGTSIFNILWLLMWHYEYFILAQIMMFALLITLILLYMNYAKGTHAFGGRLPFSLYTGWISVATIANMCYTLQHYEISLGINEVNGTIGLIVIATLLAIVTAYTRIDLLYPLVFIWAIIGIAQANSATSIETASYICCAVIGLVVIAIIAMKRHSIKYK